MSESGSQHPVLGRTGFRMSQAPKSWFLTSMQLNTANYRAPPPLNRNQAPFYKTWTMGKNAWKRKCTFSEYDVSVGYTWNNSRSGSWRRNRSMFLQQIFTKTEIICKESTLTKIQTKKRSSFTQVAFKARILMSFTYMKYHLLVTLV